MLSFRDHPTLEILDDKEVKDKIWSSGVFKKPFVLRAKEICRKWNIKTNIKTETKVISNIPPWKKLELEVHFDLTSKIQVYYSDIVINKIFLETIRSYVNDMIEIYTDGSKMFEDVTKVAAAFIIPKEIIVVYLGIIHIYDYVVYLCIIHICDYIEEIVISIIASYQCPFL